MQNVLSRQPITSDENVVFNNLSDLKIRNIATITYGCDGDLSLCEPFKTGPCP